MIRIACAGRPGCELRLVRHKRTRRSSCALIATITVLADISTAPDRRRQQNAPRRQHAGGERNRDDVVARRPPEVLHHLPIARADQRDDPRHVARIAAHEDDVACLDGHVGAGADRDADIRGHERRRVVHAVADHRDALARALELLDLRRLVLRQHLGEHACRSRAPRDRLGNGPCVAGHHHDLDAAGRAAR